MRFWLLSGCEPYSTIGQLGQKSSTYIISISTLLNKIQIHAFLRVGVHFLNLFLVYSARKHLLKFPLSLCLLVKFFFSTFNVLILIYLIMISIFLILYYTLCINKYIITFFIIALDHCFNFFLIFFFA